MDSNRTAWRKTQNATPPPPHQFFLRTSVACKMLQGCYKRRESYSNNSPSQTPFFIPLPHNPILYVHDTSFSFLSFQNKRVTITTEARWREMGCVCLSSGLRRRWRGLWLSDCWRRSSLWSSPFVLIYKSAFVWNCCHERRHSVRCLRFEQQTRQHHNGPGWSVSPCGCRDGTDNELKPTVLNQMTTFYVLHYNRRNIENYYNTLSLLHHCWAKGTPYTVCAPGQPYCIVL